MKIDVVSPVPLNMMEFPKKNFVSVDFNYASFLSKIKPAHRNLMYGLIMTTIHKDLEEYYGDFEKRIILQTSMKDCNAESEQRQYVMISPEKN